MNPDELEQRLEEIILSIDPTVRVGAAQTLWRLFFTLHPERVPLPSPTNPE